MRSRSRILILLTLVLMPAMAAIAANPVLLALPEPPQSGSGGHTVSLSWTASSDAAANPTLTYSVYRATSCTGTFTKINQNVTTTSYVDASLQPGTYCYEVTAVLNGAESTFSNTAPAVILPAAPTNTKVTGTT
jgi:fibronectin type 3 domain-containing protein